MMRTGLGRDDATREQNQAPAETGQRLAAFPRGQDQELRVTLAEFEGHRYVSLRVWAMGRDGQWWPVRGKGCSIRLGEIRSLIEALSQLEDGSMPKGGVPRDGQRPEHSRIDEPAEQRGPTWGRAAGARADQAFDEFA